jgi:hypothetical protein
MKIDLERFRELLQKLQKDWGNRPILMAQLGIELRRYHPDFQPQVYGFAKLGDLLRLFPDVGVIHPSDHGSDEFVFSGGRAEYARANNVVSTQIDARSEFRLRTDIWKAVTSLTQHNDPWKLDLQTLALRNRETDSDGLLTTEPERFLALPSLSQDFQKDLARKFAAEHCPDLADRLNIALTEPRWITAIGEIFDAANLAERWSDYRVNTIVTHVKEWADKHGIPEGKIGKLKPIDRRQVTSREHVGSPRPLDATAEMRALIHQVVDMMSAQELGALPIPPIYLTIAAMRASRSGSA